jgi:hypothetical protein
VTSAVLPLRVSIVPLKRPSHTLPTLVAVSVQSYWPGANCTLPA